MRPVYGTADKTAVIGNAKISNVERRSNSSESSCVGTSDKTALIPLLSQGNEPRTPGQRVGYCAKPSIEPEQPIVCLFISAGFSRSASTWDGVRYCHWKRKKPFGMSLAELCRRDKRDGCSGGVGYWFISRFIAAPEQ
jgi:hypothetical protein